MAEPILHITNGDSAVGALREAGIQGELLPWRDVLHDGPVPPDLPLEDLSRIRADFISASGWGEIGVVAAGFAERDAALRSAGGRDEVALWFEHDLYDQLQLVQALDWFAGSRGTGPAGGPGRLTLVPLDTFIGECPALDLERAFTLRQEATEEQFSEATRTWSAFRQADPSELVVLADHREGSLPHLAEALTRLIEEYPNVSDGLSRTERQILEATRGLGPAAVSPGAIFVRCQSAEDARFAGDAFIWTSMKRLSRSPEPLLVAANGKPLPIPGPGPEPFGGRVTLTSAGASVLRGERDAIGCVGIDRWIGGVHLRPDNLWRNEGGRLRFQD